MSPAFREEIGSVLNDSYALMAEAIAARQGITADAARALIDGGPYTPDAARKLGLVNRVAYADQVEAEVARGLGLPRTGSTRSTASRPATRSTSRGSPA